MTLQDKTAPTPSNVNKITNQTTVVTGTSQTHVKTTVF